MNDMPTCTRCARDLRDDELSRFLCRICEDRTAAALVAIPGLYQQLSQHLQRGASTGPAVSGSKTAPLPLRIDVLDAQMETGPVLGPLQAWVRDWEHHGHAELHEAGTLQDRVAGACRTLRFNLAWAVQHHPAIDEAADEIAAIVRTLQGMTGGEKPARRLHAQCPCGHHLPFTLASRGETCRGCGADYARGEIMRLPLAERRAAA
ncbi:hypothetical protein ACIGO8_08220 [Streptomyces sp. NPDC053493]|uniref:hypothetical protein n=1 Tax=Streptomyces sp. NPDC053493 TaxID=3365705 RepID=UPI0037D5B91D